MKSTDGGIFVYTDDGWLRHVAYMRDMRQREIAIKDFLKGVFAKLSDSEALAIRAAAEEGWLNDLDSISTPEISEDEAVEYF